MCGVIATLVLEGHEGANPYAGQRVATVDTPHPPGVSAVMLGDEMPITPIKRLTN